jgi:hypothetical protein
MPPRRAKSRAREHVRATRRGERRATQSLRAGGTTARAKPGTRDARARDVDAGPRRTRIEMLARENDAKNAGPRRRTTEIERVERRTPARASSAPRGRGCASETHHFVWFVWGWGCGACRTRVCVSRPFHERDFFSGEAVCLTTNREILVPYGHLVWYSCTCSHWSVRTNRGPNRPFSNGAPGGPALNRAAPRHFFSSGVATGKPIRPVRPVGAGRRGEPSGVRARHVGRDAAQAIGR